MQELFSSLGSHLLIVVFSADTNGNVFRKSFFVAMSSRVFPTFCSIRFNVSDFMLRSLILLGLSFVQVISMNLFTVFYMQPSNLISIVC